MNTFTSILVDVDATATAQPALERAAAIARKCGASLRIVDVMSAPADARRALRADLEDELMARRREKLARLAYGLREFVVAEGVDLVVMGTVGRTGVARHLWGNTVERLVDRLLCSVVAVKPATAASSVRADASA